MKIATLVLLTTFARLAAHADGPMPRPETKTFYSPDRSIVVVADPRHWLTTVYRVRKENGAREQLWSMHGWSSFMAPSNDGKHLVMANWQTMPLSVSHRTDEVMLYFVRQAQVIRVFTLDQMIDDISKAPRSVSHYRWGTYEGINSSGKFVIKTFERTLTFDLKTATRVFNK